jgi:exodeoxyribonuclease V alpha subunit
VEIKVFGEPTLIVRVPFKNAAVTVRLAYACTVHKAQGLEYDVIVMPVVDSFRHQLQRNLLYTAVTRAKQRVILVGTYSALSMSVANDREDQRNTLLQDRLKAA